MQLGSFSVSLTVADLPASVAFYRHLGFEPMNPDFGGEGWAILRNGDHVIGLFQGMFERNMLTFNPGWNQDASNCDGPFTDVRELQKQLTEAGVTIVKPVDPDTAGPGSFVVVDPDGNPILVDQHR